MSFLCGKPRAKKLIFEYKARLLMARVRYLKTYNIFMVMGFPNLQTVKDESQKISRLLRVDFGDLHSNVFLCELLRHTIGLDL